jgi:N-formylglutamate amidohydrolase
MSRAFYRAALAAALSVLVSIATADDYQPGQTYFGRNKYIEYLAGDLPVIFSAPHGGREKPDELPDREMGTFAFDTNTQELARAVAEELHTRTGHWPHVVICRVTRKKVDCNREIKEGAEGNPLTEQTWKEFQAYLDAAQEAVVKKHGRGFYIDLHGHGHENQRLELGYLHSADQLELSDDEINKSPYPAESSLKAIAARGSVPYSDLLRGQHSFGALMEARGFLCSPSPSNPHPKSPYFRGGYNTGRHARDAAPLAGLQIESHSRGVRDTPESRKKFADAIAGTLDEYLKMNMDMPVTGKLTAKAK